MQRRGAFVAVGALLVACELPSTARADDDREPLLFASAGVSWIDWAPPASIRTPGKNGVAVNGLPYDFVGRSGSMTAAGLQLSLQMASGPWVFPLFGASIAVGGGGYASSATYDGATLDRDSAVVYARLGLPGVGLRTVGPDWALSAVLAPRLDAFMWSGHLNAPPVNFDVQGDGVAFSVQAVARVCTKIDRWWCVEGGPNLFEGERFLNGGTLAVGMAF